MGGGGWGRGIRSFKPCSYNLATSGWRRGGGVASRPTPGTGFTHKKNRDTDYGGKTRGAGKIEHIYSRVAAYVEEPMLGRNICWTRRGALLPGGQ